MGFGQGLKAPLECFIKAHSSSLLKICFPSHKHLLFRHFWSFSLFLMDSLPNWDTFVSIFGTFVFFPIFYCFLFPNDKNLAFIFQIHSVNLKYDRSQELYFIETLSPHAGAAPHCDRSVARMQTVNGRGNWIGINLWFSISIDKIKILIDELIGGYFWTRAPYCQTIKGKGSIKKMWKFFHLGEPSFLTIFPL